MFDGGVFNDETGGFHRLADADGSAVQKVGQMLMGPFECPYQQSLGPLFGHANHDQTAARLQNAFALGENTGNLGCIEQFQR